MMEGSVAGEDAKTRHELLTGRTSSISVHSMQMMGGTGGAFD